MKSYKTVFFKKGEDVLHVLEWQFTYIMSKITKSPMRKNSFLYKLLYKALYFGRDLLDQDIFPTIEKYCKGNVLDVGGRDFFIKAKSHKVIFSKWTTVESSLDEYRTTNDERHSLVLGDGCNLKFGNNTFDTVLNLHVLEHVFEPVKMIKEAARVLKRNGYAIFLVPNAATLHMAPDHYYNFTRFWIEKAIQEAGLKIVKLKPLGGLWRTIAVRLFYFFLKSVRVSGMTTKQDRRNIFFYALFPLAFLYAMVNIPLTLLLSLGDLTEDPNDHLVVARKK